MKQTQNDLTRRQFSTSLLAAAGAVVAAPLGATAPRPAAAEKIPLGFDNFSVRDMGWMAPQLLEHAAKLKLDAVLLSDLFVFEKRDDEGYLHAVRDQAKSLGLILHVGTGGICPTSKRFKKDFGSAEEHLKLLLRVAKAVGSPVARCYLGSMDDRKTPGGIDVHIKSTVETLKRVRGAAMDAGVKIAVENHAGDMQAHELVRLIEEAGREFVGATIDSGNATWALEDPLRNLELLGPYSVSSGLRDSMVWENAEGAVVQWTAIGEGCVDQKRYFERFAALCPGVPAQLEIISGFARLFPYLKSDFWPPYANVKAEDFAAFLALAKRGKPIPPFSPPDGSGGKEAVQRYQIEELERSVRNAKETLGLGRR